MNMTVFGLLLLVLALNTIDAQFTCTDKRATCINIYNCLPIIEIFKGSRPLSEEILEVIRKLQCGFKGNNPFVCCIQEDKPPVTPDPSPMTPDPSPMTSGPSPLIDITPTTEIAIDIPNPPDVTNHPNLRLLDHQFCGPLNQQKVIGGNKTGIFDYPWMALIAYDTGRPTPEFRCGGTIISSRYILTAAHCVTSLPSGLTLIGVRVGDHDVSKERDCDIDEESGLEVVCAERYQDFGIDNVHFHPGFGRTKLQNDIALIRVNNTIDFRPFNVKSICLPFGTASTLNQQKAIVTGWGVTEFGPRSEDLLQAKLPLVDNDQCKEVYKRTAEIWYKQLCAGGQNMVDSCLGDSGGPLQAPGTYNGITVRVIQYGVVSFGPRQCGTEGFPGVYTRVSYYMDWILDTMRD